MARADVFIFLDDVQFSKNGYINRTQILVSGQPRWLTIPVSYRFGDSICDVKVSDDNWKSKQLDMLGSAYRSAHYFRDTRAKISELFDSIPSENLAAVNRRLVEGIAGLLDIECRLYASSDIPTGKLMGDDRLVALIRSVDGATEYLSGRGGANYQDELKFVDAGISLRYNDVALPQYRQSSEVFTPGLSVIDAAFQLGWAGAAKLLAKLVPFA
jgi:hypothetical protein